MADLVKDKPKSNDEMIFYTNWTKNEPKSIYISLIYGRIFNIFKIQGFDD